MKWAVLLLNIITIGVLGYTVYIQYTELSYYRDIEEKAIFSYQSIAKSAESLKEATPENAAAEVDTEAKTEADDVAIPAPDPVETASEAEGEMPAPEAVEAESLETEEVL